MADPSEVDNSDPYWGIDGYGSDNTPLHLFYNSEDQEQPSEKYGNTLVAPLFVGFIVLSAFFVFLMVRLNERCNKNKEERIESKEETLQKNKTRFLRRSTKEEPDDTSVLTDHHENGALGEGSVLKSGKFGAPFNPTINETKTDNEDFCMLCSKQLVSAASNEELYESNNPKCRHCFHRLCIDKWLDCQNVCPRCNQPFMIVRGNDEV